MLYSYKTYLYKRSYNKKHKPMKWKLHLKNEIIEHKYNAKNSIYKGIYLDYLDIPTNNEWKNIGMKQLEIVKEFNLKYMIDDMRICTNPIPVDMQEWVAKILVPKLIDAGLQKYAQIVSPEIIIQLSGEQMIDDALIYHQKDKIFEIKIFDNEADALYWLIGEKIKYQANAL